MAYNDVGPVNTGDPTKTSWANGVRNNLQDHENRISTLEPGNPAPNFAHLIYLNGHNFYRSDFATPGYMNFYTDVAMFPTSWSRVILKDAGPQADPPGGFKDAGGGPVTISDNPMTGPYPLPYDFIYIGTDGALTDSGRGGIVFNIYDIHYSGNESSGYYFRYFARTRFCTNFTVSQDLAVYRDGVRWAHYTSNVNLYTTDYVFNASPGAPQTAATLWADSVIHIIMKTSTFTSGGYVYCRFSFEVNVPPSHPRSMVQVCAGRSTRGDA